MRSIDRRGSDHLRPSNPQTPLAQYFTSTALVALLATTIALQMVGPRLPRQLHLPPQQTVVTSNPKIGVHTRLAGVAEEAIIQRTLQQVRAMGASWIVELFPWMYVQPKSRYGFDWAGADMIIGHARRQGLRVVARLDLVPAWAHPKDSNDRYLDPERYDDYAAFVTAFAERYAPAGVQHIIIWNEPNLNFEWGGRSPDPRAYAALLKVVYPRVKAAVPEMQILAGALSPGHTIEGTRMDDLTYLDGFYQAGGGAFFDIWAVHAYGGKSPPDEAPAPDLVNFRRTEVYAQRIAQYGDHKPLMVTEGGYNDHPRWSGAVKPSQRLRWTVATYELAQHQPDLMAVALWQFSTPQPLGSYQDNYSFVAPDGTPRAIYYAVQEAAHSTVPVSP